MGKYFTYFRVCVIASYAYRADFILYMAISMVFFYISVALWSAVYNSSGITTIDTYTLSNTITYLLITTFLFKLDLSDAMYLSDEIWNGQFTNDLIKPWNVIWVHLFATLSELVIGMLSFVPFLAFMAATTYSFISFSIGINFLFFLVTIVLALIMNFFLNLILHSLTFHFGDQRGQIQLANFIFSFLAGGMFPITFLPNTIKHFLLSLPFKFSFFIPIEIYLGKVSWQNILWYWLEIAGWILLFYLLFLIVFKRGIKKYSGTGQ